jgi:type II secretory pathway pseudopilin PulG
LELVVVLFIVAALAAVAVPLVAGSRSQAQEAATTQTLVNVRDAVIQCWQDAPRELPKRNVADSSRVDYPQLYFLFVNPATWTGSTYTSVSNFDPVHNTGWRGPYLNQATGTYTIDAVAGFTDSYGESLDKAVIDAWGNPVVLQYPGVTAGLYDVRAVSAGDNGRIDINPGTASDALDGNVGDDLYVAFTLR